MPSLYIKILSGIILALVAYFFMVFFAPSASRGLESLVGGSGATDHIRSWKDGIDHLWMPKTSTGTSQTGSLSPSAESTST